MDLLDKKEHFDNIHVYVYENEIAGYERFFQYLLAGRSFENLPFNIYHMNSTNLFLRRPSRMPSVHTGRIDEHSTFGFRSIHGEIWDHFNLTTVDGVQGFSETKPIKFSKDRYLLFANILEYEIRPYVQKAISLIEAMEEDIHSEIKSIIEQAEDQIYGISISSETIAIYGDPRRNAIEPLRKKYWKDGKYRCYRTDDLENLLADLNRTKHKLTQIAEKIEETSESFEFRELDASKLFQVKRFR